MAKYKVTVDRDVVVKREHYEINADSEEELFEELDRLQLSPGEPTKIEELLVPSDKQPYIEYAVMTEEEVAVSQKQEQPKVENTEPPKDFTAETIQDGVMINICPDTGLAYAGDPSTGQRYFIFDHCPGTMIPSECEGWHPDHPVVYTEILEVYMNLARVIPNCPYFEEIKANTTNVTALTSIQIYEKGN